MVCTVGLPLYVSLIPHQFVCEWGQKVGSCPTVSQGTTSHLYESCLFGLGPLPHLLFHQHSCGAVI